MNAGSIVFLVSVCYGHASAASAIELQRDDQAGILRIVIDGREALAYQYSPQAALPHYWPLRSPSGKLLTVQEIEPYPHHRSFWIADNVEAEGAPAVDFYHCWKNYRQPQQPESGYRHLIRHVGFNTLAIRGTNATIEAELQWVINEKRPILDETRKLRVIALGQGEYAIDLAWELRAAHGPVKFVSDGVHYAWPYLRMHPQFGGDQGGTLVNDRGQTGQKETDGKPAKWIDYSNTVDGVTEGVAVMIRPEGEPPKWLTRAYGTFGPRRSEPYSGTKFTLEAGKQLEGQVGVLVHRGDAEEGQVAERYRQYAEGQWP